MILLTTILALLCALMLGRILLGGHIIQTRSVLLHVARERAWETVQDFPALHALHGRGRPVVDVTDSLVTSGDGRKPGSICRQIGHWSGRPYWAEIEILECAPPRHLAVRLVRDSLGSERGLKKHRGDLILVSEGPGVTKLTWSLQVRLAGFSMLLARFLSPERMQTRMLDLGLRSIKAAIDGSARAEGRPAGEIAPTHGRRSPRSTARETSDMTLAEPAKTLDGYRDHP